jgi:hypothetical protein
MALAPALVPYKTMTPAIMKGHIGSTVTRNQRLCCWAVADAEYTKLGREFFWQPCHAAECDAERQVRLKIMCASVVRRLWRNPALEFSL